MTQTRGAIGVATAALLLVAVTSCANGDKDPAASEGPTPASSVPTTATTTSPPSETEVASAAASALVRNYFAVVDHVGQDVKVPLARLSSVATSTQLSAEKTLLRSQRSKGIRQIGDTRVAKLKVQSVNLDNSDPSVGKVPTVAVDVCWNVSNVDVVDKSGKSVVSPNRPNTGWTRYTVANYHHSIDSTDGWRVATGQDLNRQPCPAS